jgi:hypothetical protein
MLRPPTAHAANAMPRPATAHAASATPQRPSTASGGLVPRAEFTPNSGSASQQVRARSASNTSPKRPDKPALASMLRPMSSGVRGNSADALKSQFQFLKDQEMSIDPNDACVMLFKLGAQFVSGISALEIDLAESKAAAARAAREAASLRQDLLSKDNLLSAYNKLDFIKSSMSVSVLQTSINNIGTLTKLTCSAFSLSCCPHLSSLLSAESNIKKYDLAGSSTKGSNPQVPSPSCSRTQTFLKNYRPLTTLLRRRAPPAFQPPPSPRCARPAVFPRGSVFSSS